MQLHTLQSKTERKWKKRIGRGGKRGTTAGRGTKGQKARAGHKIRPEIRDVIKRIPKHRGYRFNSIKKASTFVISVGRLNDYFQQNDVVSRKTLSAKGLISKKNLPTISVKVVGDGKLSKKLVFDGVLISQSAREKVFEAGGTVK